MAAVVTEVPAGFPRFRNDDTTSSWACKASPARDGCTRTKKCPSCQGKANKRKGARRQGDGRRWLEPHFGPAAKWRGHLANEESWGMRVRAESKSGKQVGPIATRYREAEEQANAAKATGDTRPFVFLAMPDGFGKDGLVIFRLSALPAVRDAMAGHE